VSPSIDFLSERARVKNQDILQWRRLAVFGGSYLAKIPRNSTLSLRNWFSVPGCRTSVSYCEIDQPLLFGEDIRRTRAPHRLPGSQSTETIPLKKKDISHWCCRHGGHPAVKATAVSAHLGQQLACRYAKRFCDSNDIYQTDVSFSPLNAAYVCPMETSRLCEFLLGQSQG
jgi:hypothetical protein